MSRRQRHGVQRTFFVFLIMSGLTLTAGIWVAVAGLTALAPVAALSQGGLADCGCATALVPASWSAAIPAGLMAVLLSVITVRMVMATLRARRYVRTMAVAPLSNGLRTVAVRLGIADRVVQLAGDRTEVFCAGLLRPMIYVGGGAVGSLSPVALEAVLAHEDYHRRQRDPLRRMVLTALSFGWSTLPSANRWIGRYATSVELAADESAMERQQSSRYLADALLTLFPLRARSLPVPGFLGTTEQRIDHLLGQPTAVPGLRSLMAVVLIGLAVIFGFGLVGGRLATGASAAEIMIGQCREMRRVCTGPAPAVRLERMSTDVLLLSTP